MFLIVSPKINYETNTEQKNLRNKNTKNCGKQTTKTNTKKNEKRVENNEGKCACFRIEKNKRLSGHTTFSATWVKILKVVCDGSEFD